MIIPSTPLPTPASTAASTPEAPSTEASVGATNGGFAAIFTEAAAAVVAGVAETSQAIQTEQVLPAKTMAVIAPGKETGKGLPDVAAAALAKQIKVAAGDDADGTDVPPDPDTETADEADVDPADTLLAVLATLPTIPTERTALPETLPTTATPVQTIALPTATGNSAPSQSAPAQSAPAVPPQMAAAEVGTTLPIPGADSDGPTLTAPVRTAAPARVEQIVLAPIEVAAPDGPPNGKASAPTIAAAASVPVATVLEAQPKAAAETQNRIATAPAPATTTATAATAASTAPPQKTADPAPLLRMTAEQPAPTGTRGSALAAQAGEQPTEPSTFARPAANEAIQPLTLTQIAIGTAAPRAAATTGATPQAAVQQPQDFAALVGKIAEAREAAGTQVVRTALTHSQFGAVSLQFRPEGSGLTVTMASADPSFNTAVHAGLAASLAGQMTGDQGEAARGGDGRQAWQQGGNAPSAQTGSGSFTQDQRESPQANLLAGGQDGERRHAPQAREITREGTRDGGRSASTGDERTSRPDRGGIYA